jgi:hypothetical protein
MPAVFVKHRRDKPGGSPTTQLYPMPAAAEATTTAASPKKTEGGSVCASWTGCAAMCEGSDE